MEILLQFLLLLIVAICVIAMVRNSRKRKDLEDVTSKLEEPPVVALPDTTTETVPTPTPTDTPIDSPTDPNVTLIYAFHPVKKYRVCRFCDGENDAHAETCMVCGQKLN